MSVKKGAILIVLVLRCSIGGGGGGGGGGADFEVSQHVWKQIAIAQKLYTRGG